LKGKTHQRDIRPVLVLWKDNGWPILREHPLSLNLNLIEKEKDPTGKFFGHEVD
jgi:hypothetical protein